MISHRQLRDLGFSEKAIEHRVTKARLLPLWRGVYAVGRPELTRDGWAMAAARACGADALVSHRSAGALWKLVEPAAGAIDISVPRPRDARHTGIRVHRRRRLEADDRRELRGIPVTSPVLTLIDLATQLGDRSLERAVNEADVHDLVHANDLRAALEHRRQPGAARLRRLLGRATFALTDSELERRFLRVSFSAGLPKPLTQAHVNGHRVDFFYADLDLVVETDGLRYHRTPTQQSRDVARDQAHAAAGLLTLRFTHAQVRYEPAYVEETLARTARARGRAAAGGPDARTPPGSPHGRAGCA